MKTAGKPLGAGKNRSCTTLLVRFLQYVLNSRYYGLFVVVDDDSRLVSSKPGLLLRNLRRKLFVQVFNFENRRVKDAVVWEGTKVTITCKVYDFSKGIRLFWTEPSGENTLPAQYGLKIEKVFKRVTLSNSGRYICKASDTEGERYVSTSLFLTVEGKLLS